MCEYNKRISEPCDNKSASWMVWNKWQSRKSYRLFNCTHYAQSKSLQLNIFCNEKPYLFMSFYWMCISAKSLTHSLLCSLNRTLMCTYQIFILSMYVSTVHCSGTRQTGRTTLLASIFRSSLFCFSLVVIVAYASFYFAPTIATSPTLIVSV